MNLGNRWVKIPKFMPGVRVVTRSKRTQNRPWQIETPQSPCKMATEISDRTIQNSRFLCHVFRSNKNGRNELMATDHYIWLRHSTPQTQKSGVLEKRLTNFSGRQQFKVRQSAVQVRHLSHKTHSLRMPAGARCNICARLFNRTGAGCEVRSFTAAPSNVTSLQSLHWQWPQRHPYRLTLTCRSTISFGRCSNA